MIYQDRASNTSTLEGSLSYSLDKLDVKEYGLSANKSIIERTPLNYYLSLGTPEAYNAILTRVSETHLGDMYEFDLHYS